MDRRSFLQYLLAFPALLAGVKLSSCNNREKPITGGIVGAASNVGHLLRDKSKIPAPVKELTTNVLIAGGGIAGLSARRWLYRNGVTDTLLVEMATQHGGNSSFGQNEVSAYPWAAHYLPIPDPRNKELIDLLAENDVITGFDGSGLPVYNDYHLCHDPEERLYIKGHWQEGLIPSLGISKKDKEQIARFLKEAEELRSVVGSDGKDAFAIPLDFSSADEKYRMLDNMSFHDYLSHNGYNSVYLLWYLEYCCKDDYGCDLENTSAWAGLHYFAGRKGKAANADHSAVLTWPEGNGFLVKALKKDAGGNDLLSHLVYDVRQAENGVDVFLYDAVKKESVLVHAQKLLLATPQYVNARILDGLTEQQTRSFQYAPWMVANITINGLPPSKGMPLCWDNVVFGSRSVGYVNANHQDLERKTKKVLSLYYPFVEGSPSVERQKLHAASYEQLKEMVISELSEAHYDIRQYIENIDIMVWGHGMVTPNPGFIWGADRQAAVKNIDNKIFFAHSDLSGISIFEEAFYQGIRAANEILQQA